MSATETQPSAPALPVQAAPTTPEMLLATARSAIQAGRLDQAHSLLRSLVVAQPDDPRGWLLLAWTAPSRRSARPCFRRALALAPQHPLALDGLTWSETEWETLHRSPASAFVPLPSPLAPQAASAFAPLPSPLAPEAAPASAPASAPAFAPAFASALAPHRLAFSLYPPLYLAGIAAAEIVTTLISPQLGLAVQGGLLILLLFHASLGAASTRQKFLYALALIPLIRLLGLSMPLLHFPFISWYVLVGAPLFLAVGLLLRLTGNSLPQVGLALGRGLPLQIAVALSGLAIGCVEYLLLRPQPLVQSFNLRDLWLPALILLIFTGLLEELIFRGLILRLAKDAFKKLGPLYVSLLFAVLHIGYRSLPNLIFVFLVGYYYSLVVRRTRSILGVALAHGLTNIAFFLIFPFLGPPL